MDAYMPEGVSVGAAAYIAEDEKVKSLCALGFSPLAARHALRRCAGSVDAAAIWLLDEGNTDERLAAEVAGAQAVGPFTPGSLARVSGLRGATHLNGVPVVVQGWDQEAQRWLVQMPDGSAKSIRERNLDKLDDQAAALAAAEMENALLGAGGRDTQVGRRNDVPEGMEREASSMRAQLIDVLGYKVGSEEANVLEAFSVGELVEMVENMSRQVAPSAGTTANKVAEAPEDMDSSCCGAADPDEAAAERARVAAEAAQRAAEVEAACSSSATAACSSATVAPVASGTMLPRAQGDADPKADELAAPSREAKSQAAEPEKAAVSVAETPLAPSRETNSQVAEPAGPAADELEARSREANSQAAELAELEKRLHESAERMAAWEVQQKLQQDAIDAREANAASAEQELERRQEVARLAAENRELQLLEEAEEQRRVGEALKEEQERLEQQRRAVQLLQQSLIQSSVPDTRPGTEGACIEMSLDDSSCAVTEMAAPEALDLSGDLADSQAAVVFKPPRRSSASSRSRSDAAEEGNGEAVTSLEETSVERLGGLEDQDQVDSGEDSDTAEEVWDLDWSQVSTKLLHASGSATEAESSRDPSAAEETVMPDQSTGCADAKVASMQQAEGEADCSNPPSGGEGVAADDGGDSLTATEASKQSMKEKLEARRQLVEAQSPSHAVTEDAPQVEAGDALRPKGGAVADEA